jgi:hypothetical protein
MGTTAFLVVWLPISVTMLIAGASLLRYASELDGDGVRFERTADASPVEVGSAVTYLPFLSSDPERNARDYRRMGVVMLVGSVLALLVGTIQVW